ncbi:MAG: DNA-directed RNA polymerase subunit omega [Campylobacteraceae bacterium]|jgi:DNA-directed RNA polymerase subunit omega|nr:DNA-directed RNA polymerase subunit omega [Campylobacteraceae bacterium]
MRMEEINAKALEYAGGDRYLLSVAVNKRVDELFKGAKPLLDLDIKKIKPVDIALMEISEGLIKIKKA